MATHNTVIPFPKLYQNRRAREDVQSLGQKPADGKADRRQRRGHQGFTVMALIGQLYFSESADVSALPPSQRLRVYLTFDRTLFSVEAREQEYSCFWKVLHNHAPADEAFGKYAGQNKRRNTGARREADFEAGCQAIREYNLRIPRGTMARFEEPQELVMYLLRETILLDKHIKKCEFCGQFFIPRRSTRQYCSPACASKQRNLDGFCGEKEVSASYKRIVANLTAKDKKQ